MAKKPPLITPASNAKIIKLHKHQSEVFLSKARFRILVAGRRFGKTELALAEMLYAAQGPGRVIWYVGPSDKQSKRVAWDRLKEMTRPFWARRPRETYRRIDLAWGSTIYVNGAFKPENLRGDGLNFVVLDEAATLPPGLWHLIFRPALSDRKGRSLFIGTPKGRNHFYDQVEFARTDPDWEVFQFTTAQGELVDEAELASAARDLDPKSFRQEFEGQFTSVGRHRVYYASERATHLQSLTFDGMRPLVWSVDFNVNPMCMLLMRIEEQVHVLQEIIIKPDANTELACDEFLKQALLYFPRVPAYQLPLTVKVYGDASGNQRRTSGTATDWNLIKAFFRKWVGHFEPQFYTSAVNPLIRDRVNCVNSRLPNQLGESRV